MKTQPGSTFALARRVRRYLRRVPVWVWRLLMSVTEGSGVVGAWVVDHDDFVGRTGLDFEHCKA